MNAAHEVSPMNGGIFHSSTFTATSLRGAVILNTPSAALHAPLKPVICSMRLVSSATAGAASRVTKRSAQTAGQGMELAFMIPDIVATVRLWQSPKRMKWITREKVKVDRVACPWLIRKFIDPHAEFIFVPAAQAASKALEFGATLFDLDGCELGHHGEDVSFNSIHWWGAAAPAQP